MIMFLAMVVQTPAPDIPQVWDVPPPHSGMSGPVFVIVALALVSGFVLVFYPLMRAFARRIEGRFQHDPGIQEELDQLRTSIGEVDNLQHRVAELEERVDFTERMLAQKTPDRLPEGRS
jgi:hypothetical protein